MVQAMTDAAATLLTEDKPALAVGRRQQQTLKDSISCSGVGLHSGQKISMTMLPAAPGTGIVFRRIDIAGKGAEIPARFDHVVDTRLCTTLGNEDGAVIGTVEHLIAALAGYGIDNVVIELNGPEVPIMDGSSAAFTFLIECAGVTSQNAARNMVEIMKPVVVGDRERSAALLPGRNFSVSVEIDFDNSVIARQRYDFDYTPEGFRNELTRARTFGLEREVAQLRAMGLAKGGSLDNAVVVGEESILNEEGLRYEDEFVRHKVLDSIGDLYLAGGPILGHFHGYRCGHALNNELLRRLFADRSAWRWVTAEEAGFDDAVAEEPIAARA